MSEKKYFVLKTQVDAKNIENIFELLAVQALGRERASVLVGIDRGTGEVWTQYVGDCIFVNEINFDELNEISHVDYWAWDWFEVEKNKRKKE